MNPIIFIPTMDLNININHISSIQINENCNPKVDRVYDIHLSGGQTIIVGHAEAIFVRNCIKMFYGEIKTLVKKEK